MLAMVVAILALELTITPGFASAWLTLNNVMGDESGISGQVGVWGLGFAEALQNYGICTIYSSSGQNIGVTVLNFSPYGNGWYPFWCQFPNGFPGPGFYYATIQITVLAYITYSLSISTTNYQIN